MIEALASTVRRSAHWVHIGVLVGVGLAVELLVRLSWAGANGGVPGDELALYFHTVPGLVYHLLPIAATISVVFVHPVRAGRAAVLRLATVTTITMLLFDVAFTPAPVQVGERLVEVSGLTAAQPVFTDFDEVSVTRTVGRYLAGDLEISEAQERLAAYPPDHARRVTGLALMKAGYLLLPLLMTMTVAGVLAWANREVVFRTARAAQLFSIGVAWVAGPTIYAFVSLLTHRGRVSAMVGGGALPMVWLPYVPLALLAWIVGRKVPQAERSPKLVHHQS